MLPLLRADRAPVSHVVPETKGGGVLDEFVQVTQ